MPVINPEGVIMKATIEKLYCRNYVSPVDYSILYPLYVPKLAIKPAVQALLDRKGYVEELAKTEELMDISIICNGIIVRDDLITIEFPDGLIADYEIESDNYHRITII